MPSCASCGGDNPPQATRCEYCDQPLTGEKLVEVAWSARTSEGATGEGRVQVAAPTGADAGKVRAIVEAAFAAAVDAVGTGASAASIQADMEQRLPALLPTDHPLARIEVSHFQAFVLVAEGAEPAPRGGPTAQAAGNEASMGRTGRRIVGGVFTLLVGFCCLASGALMLAISSDEAEVAKRIARATVVGADQRASAAGLVCFEGATARVDSAVMLRPGSQGPEGADLVPCLIAHVTTTTEEEVTSTTTGADGRTRESTHTQRKSETETRSVQAFRIDGARVDLGDGAQAILVEPTALTRRVEGKVTHSFKVVRADQPITVIGQATAGVISAQPGQRVVLSPLVTKEAVLKAQRSKAKVAGNLGWVMMGFGLLLALFGLVSFLRR
jgi:hypothetical protein